MKEKFTYKLNNHEYISNYLFKYIKENFNDLIPSNFDIDKYNDEILEEEYVKYKDYFNSMYDEIDDNIHLDKEQIKAILADEDYSLIIAGAGTGKTTTMAAKVKYLVDIKGIDPSKIVVMSYTKKATEELEKRIVVDFGIPALVTTFHSLGMMYIREIFKNRKCYVVDDTEKVKIFLDYIKEKVFPYKDKIKEILDAFEINKKYSDFTIGKHFIENYDKFDTYEEYFECYKKNKLNEVTDLKDEVSYMIDKRLNSDIPITIKGELVKSKGEAMIANFLFCNGIDYSYEKVYKDLMSENRTYKPDFTLELAGEEVYIEYFGLSNYEDNKFEMNRYNNIRRIKENYHKIHHTKFIKLDYERGENIINTLSIKLKEFGFKLKPKSNEEIYYAILDSNPVAPIFRYEEFLYKLIEMIKSSPKRKQYKQVIYDYLDKLDTDKKELYSIQFKYINEFYLYYQKRLFGETDYGFDFSDMIYYANLYINKINLSNRLQFKYLIIDEYQDISQDRYELAKNVVNKNNSKVVAVGDDWQAIFAFAGSKIKYIYNFEKYFKGSKLLNITRTYRNSQELINYSGNFIMKNDDQIKKQLISSKNINNPIRFVMFYEGDEYQVLKSLILNIHEKNPNHKILILGRYNETIKKCYDDPDLIDSIDTKLEFVGYEDIEIDAMTIHKSKGLTSDEVIIIGLNQSFPNSEKIKFWMECIFKQHMESESIPFAEERRLFYVALTRTKNYVFLLVNKNPKLRSPFVNEIFETIKEVDSAN